MHDVITQYWWVPIFSIPVLAVVIKRVTENTGLVDSLSAPLRRKLSGFDHSFPEHWVVTATMRDGRRYSRLVINDRFQLDSQGVVPVKLRDVEDVAWEGPVPGPVGPVVPLSDR